MIFILNIFLISDFNFDRNVIDFKKHSRGVNFKQLALFISFKEYDNK